MKILHSYSIFYLTNEEKKYLFIVAIVFFIGLIARYFYLKNETTSLYTPSSISRELNDD